MFKNWNKLNAVALCLVLLVPFILGTQYVGIGEGLLEDAPHVSGDPGVLQLGIRNDDLATDLSGVDGDNTGISVTQEGSVYTTPSFGINESSTIQLGGREDVPFATGHAGMKILAVRNDGLDANALVSLDGDLTQISVNNRGALWTHTYQPLLEFDLEAPPLELIGINEQVSPDEYSGSINFFFNGASGFIKKICLYTTEDNTGTIFKAQGTLYIFNLDPAIASGDSDITAAERLNIVSQYSFVTADWEVDSNGGSACKLVDDVFVTTFLFMSWFTLTGETTWNSNANDDEQLQILMWSQTMS